MKKNVHPREDICHILYDFIEVWYGFTLLEVICQLQLDVAEHISHFDI